MEFATFIQPEKQVNREGREVTIKPMAVFVVVSDNPIYPGFRVMTHGTVLLESFQQTEQAAKHYVFRREDPVVTIYRPIIARHLETIGNLRALNH